jgi:hypothetical protein
VVLENFRVQLVGLLKTEVIYRDNRYGFYCSDNPYLKRTFKAARYGIDRGPLLTSPLRAKFDPQRRSCPPGGNLVPKG